MINSPSINHTSTSTQVKAMLAGGLVLGIGAAVTLAAWNDSEFATGIFTSGHFEMEGSTDGTAFSINDSAPGLGLTFSLGFDNLAADETVSALWALRLDSTTNYDAEVTINSATATGAAASELSYGIVEVPSAAACTPTATGTQVVPAGTALGATAGSTVITLDRSTSLGTLGGVPAFLCVQVTASPDLAQSSTATGVWEFVATALP